jgi:glucan phosphorylase
VEVDPETLNGVAKMHRKVMAFTDFGSWNYDMTQVPIGRVVNGVTYNLRTWCNEINFQELSGQVPPVGKILK